MKLAGGGGGDRYRRVNQRLLESSSRQGVFPSGLIRPITRIVIHDTGGPGGAPGVVPRVTLQGTTGPEEYGGTKSIFEEAK